MKRKKVNSKKHSDAMIKMLRAMTAPRPEPKPEPSPLTLDEYKTINLEILKFIEEKLDNYSSQGLSEKETISIISILTYSLLKRNSAVCELKANGEAVIADLKSFLEYGMRDVLESSIEKTYQ